MADADVPASSSSPIRADPDTLEQDDDAEMAGTEQQNSEQNQEHSSSTIEQEFTQPEEQPAAQPTTSVLHPNRKDATLREFLSKMDDYAPIIPDAVTAHYLTLSGLPPPSPDDPTGLTTNTTPLPLARLLALATQKFISDVAADAYQYSRSRQSNTAAGSNPLGGAALPGQPVASGAGGAGGTKGGAQAAQLGVQRSGYGGGGQGGSGQGRTVLTMEDLGMAVQDYGINVKRAEFYR